MNEPVNAVENSPLDSQGVIEESFEEILGWNDDVDVETEQGETEPLCGSCFAPLDVDEEQTIAYCDRCQTTVFVERRHL